MSLLLALALAAPQVQAPTPLRAIVPDCVTRGRACTVVLHGGGDTPAFDPTAGVVIQGFPGAAEVVRRAADRLTVSIRIPEDGSPGRFDLRVVSPRGVSNAEHLHVSDLPVLAEREPNNTPAIAQAVTLDQLVTGTMHAPAERDCFRFEARAGAALQFELRRPDAASKLDGVMAVVDASGREVAWSAAHGAVRRLTFKPQRDGTHHLILQDVQFGGGPDHRYHLRIARPGAEAPPTSGPTTDPGPVRTPPFQVARTIDATANRDAVPFRVTRRTTLRVTVRGGPADAAFDPLLELADAAGRVLEIDDDDGGGEAARIQRTFAPGTYTVRVRNLLGPDGSEHGYRLDVGPPTEPQDFEVRLRPDTIRVSRGSQARLWCEVIRRGGFQGEVTLSFPGLPDGLAVPPITLGPGNGWSSVFTLHATATAPQGSLELAPRATGMLDSQRATRHPRPEAGDHMPTAAWVTVLPAPPFTVRALGPPAADVQARWRRSRARLVAKLAATPPRLQREFAEFQERHASGKTWTTARLHNAGTSAQGTFQELEDGSLLAKAPAADVDTFTVEFQPESSTVGALRLDVLTHPSLPKSGPGRQAASGNFVLSELALAVQTDPKAPWRPVPWGALTASFSQKDYDAARAIDGKPETGWAVHPREGQPHWLILEPRTPLTLGTKSRLRLTIDQQHGGRHLIGRFRVSLAAQRLPARSPLISPAVQEALQQPEDAAALAWFKTIAPSLRKTRDRIAAIDSGRGNEGKIQRLERRLRAETPEIVAARNAWVAAMRARLTHWTDLVPTMLKSTKGVRFDPQPDNVIRVRRPTADRDDYTVVAQTDVAGITAIRLEALPEESLPRGGPGLAKTGNFVLSTFELEIADADRPNEFRPVALHAPEASFEQAGYPIRGTLDKNPETGWALYGWMGQTSHGLWRIQTPVGTAAGSILRIRLRHQSRHKRHQLGRFRLAITAAARPSLRTDDLPMRLTRALATAAERRTPVQQQAIREYYRRTAQLLEPIRADIDRLRAEQVLFPLALTQGSRGTLAVAVERRPGFAGPVTITLEGFASGRERDRRPRAIQSSLAVGPVVLAPERTVATFPVQAKAKSETGTRAVVLRASATIDGQDVVEYSAAFPVTVTPPQRAATKPR